MAKSKAMVGLWVGIVVVGCGAVIVLCTGPQLFEKEAIEAFDYNGEVDEIHLVQTDGLQGLIIGEDVREDYSDGTLKAKKLSVFDLNDGRRVTMLSADDQTDCAMLAGDLLWCYDHELGLHGRDPVHLEPVWDQSALASSGPRLRGKVRKRSQDFEYEEATGRILIKTDQGYYYFLDAKNRSIAEAPDDARVSSPHYHPTSNYADLPTGERLQLTGNERKHIQIDDARSESSFLKADFLKDKLTGQVLLLPGPQADLVIAHWTHLNDHDNGVGLLLSRVTPAGREVWTVDVEHLFEAPEDEDPSRALEATYLTPQGLLLIYSLANRGKLLMLDPATGAVRWKRAL